MGGHIGKVWGFFSTKLLVVKCKESLWREDIFISGFV